MMNGGFGMVLDGSKNAEQKLQSMLAWDVNNGVARRAWARNDGAEETIQRTMVHSWLTVPPPNHCDDDLTSPCFEQST